MCIGLCYGYLVNDIDTQVCIELCYGYLVTIIDIQVSIGYAIAYGAIAKYCEGNQHQVCI